MSAKTCRNLILILGDQLSADISSLRQADPEVDTILIAEVMAEATYVPHHKKKIVFLFSAMRHFAQELRDAGWTVEYVKLDDTDNTGSFEGEMRRAVSRLAPERVVVTEPGEWRVLENMRQWQDVLGVPVEIKTDNRFFCDASTFRGWADGRKQLRMENFYREMRKSTGLLMDGDKPVGGKWNYDAENRKPAKQDLFMPAPLQFEPDAITQEVLDLVEDRFEDHIGQLDPFWFAVTRAQAEEAFDHFLKVALENFGTYQDAMLRGEKFLYHAVISAYLNAGLLSPKTVCEKVEEVYFADKCPLNAAEGFIRQILGWREYVRGIYWLKMPGYARENALKGKRPLPVFYWTGETSMKCVQEAVGQTLEEAYAHHIQRLMVTGNFALLAGVDPVEVHEWYLAVYADAYEWVELPNTLGMSQFADGGLLASKPYISSGNYINKMSDYCENCDYSVRKKTGEGACPFNALYWDFLDRHAEELGTNPRLGQPYATWRRMSDETKQEYLDSAEALLEKLDAGEMV
ncbi:cryptochrome/photolyase family protein [Roseibium sp.]|uniref:cryptochrome/photolyase family protein n=1 Tax=Roseibium sp. TaxID=1936156 RepID=UPI003B50FB66